MLSSHHIPERAYLLPGIGGVLALCGLFLVMSWLAETLSAPISTHDAWVLGHSKTQVPAVTTAPIPLHLAWTALGNHERFDKNALGLGTLQPLDAPCDCIEAGATVNAFQSHAPVAAAGLLQPKTQLTWIEQSSDLAHRFDHLDLRLDLAEMAAYQRSIVTWQKKCLENHYFCGLR